ncbi:hypothetical protein Pflav_008580 [Phytohabitans flavus]|uniref:Uncharacterized protein n=1 Tax=Phytohabitans flavus TaxID=1076124 RepID=A0A6F8XKX8_9ACTN|nr:hypothetical protein Pflav_008580 [Phytohabitans flavus]
MYLAGHRARRADRRDLGVRGRVVVVQRGVDAGGEHFAGAGDKRGERQLAGRGVVDREPYRSGGQLFDRRHEIRPPVR